MEKSLHCVWRGTQRVLKGAKLNLDRLNLTQTHAIAHAPTDTVIRLSTNIIWVEWWVFSETHLFPSHYWRQEKWGWRDMGGGEGGWWWWREGCYWYAPCGANTWLIFVQPFKWLPPFGSSVLPADSPLSTLTEEQVNANELRTFKGTFGSKSCVFGVEFCFLW